MELRPTEGYNTSDEQTSERYHFGDGSKTEQSLTPPEPKLGHGSWTPAQELILAPRCGSGCTDAIALQPGSA